MIRILILVICFSSSYHGYAQTLSDSSKIDQQLSRQFELLDQYMEFYENVNLDTIDISAIAFQRQLVREQKAIDLFEILTGIEAQTLNIYAYGKIVDQQTVDLWKTWIVEHRNLLKWEAARDTVNRADKDIYLNGLQK